MFDQDGYDHFLNKIRDIALAGHDQHLHAGQIAFQAAEAAAQILCRKRGIKAAFERRPRTLTDPAPRGAVKRGALLLSRVSGQYQLVTVLHRIGRSGSWRIRNERTGRILIRHAAELRVQRIRVIVEREPAERQVRESMVVPRMGAVPPPPARRKAGNA